MGKVEILAELPKLTREERREVVKKVHEIDGDDWLDEGELSDEEKTLLEARGGARTKSRRGHPLA